MALRIGYNIVGDSLVSKCSPFVHETQIQYFSTQLCSSNLSAALIKYD